jgi:flagellar hook-associated protein 1
MTRMLSIGVSGLSAAQTGLATTGHNISNVNTPGFSRQRVEQTTREAQATGGGYIGRGTNVETVRRIYSEFLNAQTRDADSQVASAEVLSREMARLSSLLADDTSGVGPAVTRLFASFGDLASNPADLAVRATVLASAESLTTRIGELNTRINALRADANAGIENSVSQINALTTQIADINERIRLGQANGQPPNDLLDQRDQHLRDLSKLVRTSVVKQTDGTLNVFIGSGQTLVSGTSRFALSTDVDPADPSNRRLLLTSAAGSVPLSTTALGGGELAAGYEFRDGTLNNAQTALGRIATVLGTQINRQHALGVDRAGNMGGAFFNVGTPFVVPNGANTGAGVLTAAITNETLLQASDYRVTYDGTNYTVTRLQTGASQVFAAFPATLEGVQFSIAGAPAAGDSFIVQTVRTGAANLSLAITDPARVAASSPVIAASASANLGNGRVSGTRVNGPTANVNLQQPVTLTFTSANTFDVVGTGTGNPTGVPYTAGAAITYNGWTIELNGQPRVGDTFTVSANPSGVADNTNARALGSLQSALVVNGATLPGAFGQMVSAVGVDTREAEIQLQAQQNVLTAAESAQQSVAGVNLDEEAANLVRYQQAYQAAARYIAVANTLFDEILQIGR